MTLRNLCILLLTIILHHCTAVAQSRSTYIDSINTYKLYIDSLIDKAGDDSTLHLQGLNADYTCDDEETGACTQLFFNSQRTAFRLTWKSYCTNDLGELVFYFYNNKIVLVVLKDIGTDMDFARSYFKGDVLVSDDKPLEEYQTETTKNLERGYYITNDMINTFKKRQ